MHDIWNPWHGCRKCSPGCENCYMYYLDETRAGRDGSEIRRNSKALFDYPVAKDRSGDYKIKAGERIRVCMTSDFFLQEADPWRQDAWDLIRRRPDVIFWLLTKRPGRIRQCLPADWGDGYDNVILNVTAENQAMADIRLPLLLSVPAKHYGVCVAPWIGPVSLLPWLDRLDSVCGGGENYAGARLCDLRWVKSLRDECGASGTEFCFYETGTVFAGSDGKPRCVSGKSEQSRLAYLSGMNLPGTKPVTFVLRSSEDGHVLGADELRTRSFCPHCRECANRLICNGCSHCDRCGWGKWDESGGLYAG